MVHRRLCWLKAWNRLLICFAKRFTSFLVQNFWTRHCIAGKRLNRRISLMKQQSPGHEAMMQSIYEIGTFLATHETLYKPKCIAIQSWNYLAGFFRDLFLLKRESTLAPLLTDTTVTTLLYALRAHLLDCMGTISPDSDRVFKFEQECYRRDS